MTHASLAPIGILLLVACIIAMLTRRLGLPYIVGLVVAGFLIALLPSVPELPLSRDLIFNVLLPPLVFEAALQLDWRRFRSELPLTITLAFLGVGI
ncbi:MAG TPA: cation:proton antiporter, partial [Sphingomicrobium sp.]